MFLVNMVINNYNSNSSKSIASFLSRKPNSECFQVLTAEQTIRAREKRKAYGGVGGGLGLSVQTLCIYLQKLVTLGLHMLDWQQKLHMKLPLSYCTLVPDNHFKLTCTSARKTNLWAHTCHLLGQEGLHVLTCGHFPRCG